MLLVTLENLCWSTDTPCSIKISEPLMKLRPARELKDVLLHEMIHASMMLGKPSPAFAFRQP